MWISDDEKEVMKNIIVTLIYNTKDDLKNKIIEFKPLLRKEVYKLLIDGDEYVYTEHRDDLDKYRSISCLEKRWCLKTQLYYHATRTKKITIEDMDEILGLFSKT
tara:strand:- start:461 stop:775 length:315 start_codon:yes stop_codon:yes gene_type:complete